MSVPWPVLIDVHVFGDKLTTVLFGIEAVSVTPVALSGPALLTFTEYVTLAPELAVSGALRVIPKSAPPESAWPKTAS